MLASPPVRAAGERVGGLWLAAVAAVVSFCALFFGGADSTAPLVWIGALALVLAGVLLLEPPALELRSLLYLGGLAGLAVWCGLSVIWSTSPDRTWIYTNRTLVYLAFALVGVLVGSRVARAHVATAAAVLVALVVGWALLAKCMPALYSDCGRLARLRSPLGYWNELALVCDAGVPFCLWLAVTRRRVEGVLLLYGSVLALLLTYSRFGVLLACGLAIVWLLIDRQRVESLVALALGGAGAAAAFGVVLALPGITNDGEPRHVRAHDGWIFALVVVAFACAVGGAAFVVRGRSVGAATRARIERAAAIGGVVLAIAGVALCIAFAGHLWHEFTNPGNTQVVNTQGRLGTAKSDRWVWWQEAWHAFTRHPLGGTGAGTFELTNQMLRRAPVVVDEPHNTPLQFLSETGIVGLALGLGVAAFFVHNVVDKDWNYVATCGPLLLLGGVLVARRTEARARRPFVAVAAVLIALAVVYSLAAPWLAQRAFARGTESGAKQAHSYDPLSVDALTLWATYEEPSNLAAALDHYEQAVKLEPENAETWYDLGAFYARHGRWLQAYDALNNSYTYDRFGLAARPCGLLDEARLKAHNYAPQDVLRRCPGLRRASS